VLYDIVNMLAEARNQPLERSGSAIEATISSDSLNVSPQQKSPHNTPKKPKSATGESSESKSKPKSELASPRITGLPFKQFKQSTEKPTRRLSASPLSWLITKEFAPSIEEKAKLSYDSFSKAQAPKRDDVDDDTESADTSILGDSYADIFRNVEHLFESAGPVSSVSNKYPSQNPSEGDELTPAANITSADEWKMRVKPTDDDSDSDVESANSSESDTNSEIMNETINSIHDETTDESPASTYDNLSNSSDFQQSNTNKTDEASVEPSNSSLAELTNQPGDIEKAPIPDEGVVQSNEPDLHESAPVSVSPPVMEQLLLESITLSSVTAEIHSPNKLSPRDRLITKTKKTKKKCPPTSSPKQRRLSSSPNHWLLTRQPGSIIGSSGDAILDEQAMHSAFPQFSDCLRNEDELFSKLVSGSSIVHANLDYNAACTSAEEWRSNLRDNSDSDSDESDTSYVNESTDESDPGKDQEVPAEDTTVRDQRTGLSIALDLDHDVSIEKIESNLAMISSLLEETIKLSPRNVFTAEEMSPVVPIVEKLSDNNVKVISASSSKAYNAEIAPESIAASITATSLTSKAQDKTISDSSGGHGPSDTLSVALAADTSSTKDIATNSQHNIECAKVAALTLKASSADAEVDYEKIYHHPTLVDAATSPLRGETNTDASPHSTSSIDAELDYLDRQNLSQQHNEQQQEQDVEEALNNLIMSQLSAMMVSTNIESSKKAVVKFPIDSAWLRSSVKASAMSVELRITDGSNVEVILTKIPDDEVEAASEDDEDNDSEVESEDEENDSKVESEDEEEDCEEEEVKSIAETRSVRFCDEVSVLEYDVNSDESSNYSDEETGWDILDALVSDQFKAPIQSEESPRESLELKQDPAQVPSNYANMPVAEKAVEAKVVERVSELPAAPVPAPVPAQPDATVKISTNELSLVKPLPDASNTTTSLSREKPIIIVPPIVVPIAVATTSPTSTKTKAALNWLIDDDPPVKKEKPAKRKKKSSATNLDTGSPLLTPRSTDSGSSGVSKRSESSQKAPKGKSAKAKTTAAVDKEPPRHEQQQQPEKRVERAHMPNVMSASYRRSVQALPPPPPPPPKQPFLKRSKNPYIRPPSPPPPPLPVVATPKRSKSKDPAKKKKSTESAAATATSASTTISETSTGVGTTIKKKKSMVDFAPLPIVDDLTIVKRKSIDNERLTSSPRSRSVDPPRGRPRSSYSFSAPQSVNTSRNTSRNPSRSSSPKTASVQRSTVSSRSKAIENPIRSSRSPYATPMMSANTSRNGSRATSPTKASSSAKSKSNTTKTMEVPTSPRSTISKSKANDYSRSSAR
jgi:hypothetical protein